MMKSGGACGESFRLKSPRHAAGFDRSGARGEDVHGAIAHHDRALAIRAGFGDQAFDADGVRFLFLKTIAAVDLKKMLRRDRARQSNAR